MKIGVMDSGFGGLSVLHPMMFESIGAQAEYYYVCDPDFSPYGDKSTESLRLRIQKIVRFFEEEGVDALVIACHTATAHSVDDLREEFKLPIIGVEPYVNIFDPGLIRPGQKAILLATENTLKSQRVDNLLKRRDPNQLIETFAPRGLAWLIDQAIGSGQENIFSAVEAELAAIRQNHWDLAILGCTHYSLIHHHIEKILGANCIGPGPAIAKRVADVLQVSFENFIPREDFYLCQFERPQGWKKSNFDIIPWEF